MPQDSEFYEQIRKEAESVVRKLRTHASIVLWSGDNECDAWMMLLQHMDPGENRITREILPQVVRRCDPARPYLPSSPYYSPKVYASRDESLIPEYHLWGPRDYYKSTFYTRSTAHFISEIGYHGCPNLSSIRQFIDEQHLWPWKNNDQWIAHATSPTGNIGPYLYRIELMAMQIQELFGHIPEDIESFIFASQISQAEAVKFFIEMVRLSKPRRTGILWWNVMDGWPQFSDAVVDYYFEKKLAYHYIRRVQQPVAIMIDEPDSWHVRVTAGNDSLHHRQVRYRVWDADDGKTLLEGDLSVGVNENQPLGQIRVSRGEQKCFLIEWTTDSRTYGNHYLHGMPPFDLDRYRRWLASIAELSETFRAERVGQ